ncbi:hypothetical protein [Verminephrobacter eiseniae]|uniref:hypothetical protein n=1 Tax=Verminephrobacter eiseniae TaxID=364317 RepID=UPI002236F336|nr:hypothetical protein [Verminephrobacter eiseniae]
MSRHRPSVGLRWPSKRIAALQRLPIRSVLAARCALRCAPVAARSLRHLIGDATLVSRHRPSVGLRWPSKRSAAMQRLPIRSRSVWAARCALRCAPMAARSLRHLTDDATLAAA